MEQKTENNQLQKVTHNDMQMMPISEAQNWYNEFVAFSKSILKPDLDFGTIPGTPKPSLYKPGAEKLRFVYGLGTEQECIEKTVDLDKLFVDYTYRCTIKSKQGQILSQCEASCNSMEPKFGYLWKTIHELPEGIDISRLLSKSSGKKSFEFDFAINKSETSGQYGKPLEYWDKWKSAIESGAAKRTSKKSKAGKDLDGWEMDDTVTLYRVTNPDVIGMKNTIMKMAQKRAFVGAILLATGASEFFTQDIEDMEINGAIYSNDKKVHFEEAEFTEVKSTEEKKTEAIPGHWYAKLEKCKAPAEVDELGKKHADTVNANPDLRKLFVHRKDELKKQAIQQTEPVYSDDLPF